MNLGEIRAEQFTEKAWSALEASGAGATARKGGVVEPEDLLVAMLKQDSNGLLNRALRLCEPPADEKVLRRLADEKLSGLPQVDGAQPRFGPRTEAAIGDALTANAVLTTLVLARNGIGDAGAAALGDALKLNAAMSKLFLSDNHIGLVGAAAIADALAINTAAMKELVLYNNRIGAAGFRALAAAKRERAASLVLHM